MEKEKVKLEEHTFNGFVQVLLIGAGKEIVPKECCSEYNGSSGEFIQHVVVVLVVR